MTDRIHRRGATGDARAGSAFRRNPPLGLFLVIAVVLSGLVGVLQPAPVAAVSETVVISEVRFRGPSGGNDEFVELLNKSASAVDVSNWRLEGCSSSSVTGTRATIPASTTLNPGGHYLFTNSGSSGYSGSVAGDQTYSTGFAESGGTRITRADGTVVDGVGAAGSPCTEGTGLSFPGANSNDNAFERKNGGRQDTDVNGGVNGDFEGPKASDPQACGMACSAPPPAVRRINEIQGNGASSPLTSQTVTIEGIVTGIDDEIGVNTDATRFFPNDAGIFVQEENTADPATDDDADPATSEGIFVGNVTNRANYPRGTVVRVQGQVREQFGFTIIVVENSAQPTILTAATNPSTLPAEVVIDPAAANAQTALAQDGSRSYYELLEGMRVRLATGVANSGGTNKFGELFLTPGTERDRVFRSENVPALIAADADAGAGNPPNPARPANESSTLVRADLLLQPLQDHGSAGRLADRDQGSDRLPVRGAAPHRGEPDSDRLVQCRELLR